MLDGLIGFGLHGKTVAVIGTGKIGYDKHASTGFAALGARYAERNKTGDKADFISLACQLTPETHHIVNAETLSRGKRGVLLINTSRGGLIDAEGAIEALKSSQLSGLGIDVYKQEGGLVFRDLSRTIIDGDVFQRLIPFLSLGIRRSSPRKP